MIASESAYTQSRDDQTSVNWQLRTPNDELCELSTHTGGPDHITTFGRKEHLYQVELVSGVGA